MFLWTIPLKVSLNINIRDSFLAVERPFKIEPILRIFLAFFGYPSIEIIFYAFATDPNTYYWAYVAEAYRLPYNFLSY